MDDILVRKNRLEERIENIAFRDKKFRDIATAQAEIPENIFTQMRQLLLRFIAIQNRDRIAALADNGRLVLKIIFKITRRIVASGGDDGVEIFEFAVHESDVIFHF